MGLLLSSPLECSSAGREAAAQGTATARGDAERGLQLSDPDAAEAECLPTGAQHHTADPDGQAAGEPCAVGPREWAGGEGISVSPRDRP